MSKEKKNKSKNKEEELEEGAPLCPECGSSMIKEGDELICPKCDAEIDFFGDDD